MCVRESRCAAPPYVSGSKCVKKKRKSSLDCHPLHETVVSERELYEAVCLFNKEEVLLKLTTF